MELPPQCLSESVAREKNGTQVLWCAKPLPWAYAKRKFGDAWVVVIVLVFAVWLTRRGSELLSQMSGIPHKSSILRDYGFVLIGLAVVLLPLLAALWKATRTFYVVTDRSAIIFEKTLLVKIRSFDFSDFGGFERVCRGTRQGDIVFDRKIEQRGKRTVVTEVGFLGLRDFSEAEQALRSMVKSKTKME